MFIKNKRTNYPSEIRIRNATVKVVDQFTLLGVTIDSKLNFITYIALKKKEINKKIHSIKRLFYLSLPVKIQFFKSYILPYFNYCITLCIYFPKTSLQSLCNFYYFSLHKILKFNVPNNVINANIFLDKYNLSSFQHLILTRLSHFIHKIVNNSNSPYYLKSSIKIQNNLAYNLRSNQITFENHISRNRYGDLTFNSFFPKFLNILFKNEIHIDSNLFKLRTHNNINIYIEKFILNFPKFDLLCKNYSY